MYQVSDHTRSQFEKMLGLASVKEAGSMIILIGENVGIIIPTAINIPAKAS